jgi:exodeoxyribonuclease V alpha subunit
VSRPAPAPSKPPESLSGLIERVTFFNEENGFAVLKVKVKGHREEVSVVGALPSVSPGEWLTAEGYWVRDREFGLQFRAELLSSSAPTTIEGIEKYLGSGMVKGIGPVYAKKLVRQFGERIFEVIENESARLQDVEGIGPERRRRIKDAWAEQKIIRQIMVFLHSNGVSTSRAVRIYKLYGENAIETVRSNPYTLSQDIPGIGFKTADQIAQKIGIPHDSVLRACAGLNHVLLEATGQGHCALPEDMLMHEAAKLLEVNRPVPSSPSAGERRDPPHPNPLPKERGHKGRLMEREQIATSAADRSPSPQGEGRGEGDRDFRHPTLPASSILDSALQRCLAEDQLVRETIAGHDLLFLPQLLKAEQTVAARIRELAGAPATYPAIDFEKAAAWCQQKTGKELAPTQRDALHKALTTRLLIITGGPGVGKTTLVNAILLILRAKKVQCLLCAPTGRAAKRLSETTGLQAKTIHRLLEVQPGGGFARRESNPLDCDLLVVDETSMVDVSLMQSLLRGLPRNAGLLLVGDVDQLPSVGPGNVLRDLIASGVAPVVRLTEVFRQASDSRIITNAHRINQGQMPELPEKDKADADFYFIERERPEQISDTLLETVRRRIPARFGLDPIRDIQILSPMNRGSLGIRELNARLQADLNPPRPDQNSVEKFGVQFRVGDKVIQTENDYDKEVFNGDIGVITKLDIMEKELTVTFERRDVRYDFGELDELSLAYAITIHKSQGSEFPAVVIPLATQHFMLLQRNLVYTGVTRGKRLVVLIGQRKALSMAVQNNKISQRFSGLLDRLKTSEP